MSDWMRPGMPETQWKRLDNGSVVNVLKDDTPCVISVHFTDPKELERDFVFSLNGRVVDYITLNGERLVRAKQNIDWEDRCECD